MICKKGIDFIYPFSQKFTEKKLIEHAVNGKIVVHYKYAIYWKCF